MNDDCALLRSNVSLLNPPPKKQGRMGRLPPPSQSRSAVAQCPMSKRQRVATNREPAQRPPPDADDLVQVVVQHQEERFAVSLPPRGATVATLKAAVRALKGFAEDQQRLIFGGRQLQDPDVLAACGIGPGVTVILAMRMPPADADGADGADLVLRVQTLTGRTLHVRVRGADTVMCLKALVRERAGVPEDQQVLIYRGQTLQPGGRSIADCGLQPDGVVHLIVRDSWRPAGDARISVFVKTLTGRTVAVQVRGSDRISALKSLIRDKEGCPEDQQRLVFAGQQLEDDRSVDDHRLMEHSTVHMVLRLRGYGAPAVYFQLSALERQERGGFRMQVCSIPDPSLHPPPPLPPPPSAPPPPPLRVPPCLPPSLPPPLPPTTR